MLKLSTSPETCNRIVHAPWFQRFFTGIIMNSMSEMHAELEPQLMAKQHLTEHGSVLSDLTALDQQLSTLKSQLKELRGKPTNDTP